MMKGEKGDRPSVGAPGRPNGSGTCKVPSDPIVQFTTPAPAEQSVKIADFLSKGEAHAIPLRHLRELLHLPARTARLMIRAERLAGTPILESSKATGGYYLPSNDHERARCVRSMRRRAAEIVRAADAIEGAEDIGR